jgi:hypothetical protein
MKLRLANYLETNPQCPTLIFICPKSLYLPSFNCFSTEFSYFSSQFSTHYFLNPSINIRIGHLLIIKSLEKIWFLLLFAGKCDESLSLIFSIQLQLKDAKVHFVSFKVL